MKIYRAEKLIDGTGAEAQSNLDIVVDDDGLIQEIVPAGTKSTPDGARLYENPGMTVLPGFIDVHTHLMFGEEGRSYRDVWANDSDGLMLLRGPRNAYLHLRAGVTTMRDCGAVRNVGFDLRAGANAGYFLSPRLLVCGRPLTITGGHFWWCGQEADGVDGVRRAVRELVKDGADFLKIMCDGGRQDDIRASFSVEELAVAVEEIHRVGKRAVAHCEAAEAIDRAAEAGIDEIEHINFLQPDGSRVWDQAIAAKILKKGLYVCPTIQTGWRRIERLQAQEKAGTCTRDERKLLDASLYKTDTKLEFVRRFHEMGVPIVAGTDSIATFGDYAIGLELLHRAGLSPMDTIRAATSVAATSIGLDDRVGTIKPGMLADLVYVDGDPLSQVAALGRVRAVILAGQLVAEKPDNEAAADGMLFHNPAGQQCR